MQHGSTPFATPRPSGLPIGRPSLFPQSAADSSPVMTGLDTRTVLTSGITVASVVLETHAVSAAVVYCPFSHLTECTAARYRRELLDCVYPQFSPLEERSRAAVAVVLCILMEISTTCTTFSIAGITEINIFLRAAKWL